MNNWGMNIITTRQKHMVPLVGCLLGLILTGAFFLYIKDDLDNEARLRFERQTNDAKHIIEMRLLSHVNFTYGLRGLFSSTNLVSRLEFHRYVSSLNLKHNFPGFEVLNYARLVKDADKQRFEEEVRRDTSLDARGYPEFAIRPPGTRPEYEVMLYLEPMQGNEFAFGLDISVSPGNRQVQARARDTGELVTSGRLRSIGENRFVGLAMRLPVYRSGWQIGRAHV